MILKTLSGEDHPLSKLTNAERVQCRRAWLDGAKVEALARAKGVSARQMLRTVKDPRWGKKGLDKR